MANFLPLILIMNAASLFLGMNLLEFITWFRVEDMAGGIRSMQKLGARPLCMQTSFPLLQLQAEVRLPECFATREPIFPQGIRGHFFF